MGDSGPAGADEGALGFGQVDAVREDNAVCEGVGFVVNVGVAGGLGDEGVDEGDFVEGFGDVGLDVQWGHVGCGEGAEEGEGGFAAAWVYSFSQPRSPDDPNKPMLGSCGACIWVSKKCVSLGG